MKNGRMLIGFLAAALLMTAAVSGCAGSGSASEREPSEASIPENTGETEVVRSNEETSPAESDVIPSEEMPEGSAEAGSNDPAPEYSIRPAEWAAVEWERYSSPYFTLNLPKGWQVDWGGDANQLQWTAMSADMSVGICNRDHIYASKDPRMTAYQGFGFSLENGTVQEFFETIFSETTEYFTVHNSCVPENKDYLQSLRPYTPIRDYQALYATYKDAVGEGEGIYSAVIMESQDVVVGGYNYGAWEINVVLYEYAPFGSLVNWLPVLKEIAQSFAYTDYYIQQWRMIAQSAVDTPSSVSDTDPVMEAFEERSRSDTIIQEKRSDMIGEYERVYDNDSGNIYRAYNGFLDDMGDQNRFIQITDDQYAEGFVGWIDR